MFKNRSTRATQSPTAIATAIGLVASALVASPALAAPGENALYLADNQRTTIAETQFNLGNYATYLAGDVNGDGIDEIVVSHDNRTFQVVRISDIKVIGTINMPASNNGAFIGDFDGDGVDELAVRTGNTFTLQSGRTVSYGRPADIPYIGDFDGDGKDTFAVRRGNTFYFKNTIAGGEADHVAPYGRVTDDVYMGDWNGDGLDTFMVRRGNTNYFKDDLSGGEADTVVPYGRIGDGLLIGDWTGTGAKTLGVIRANTAVETRISPAVKAAAAAAGQDASQSPTPGDQAPGEVVPEEVIRPPSGATSGTSATFRHQYVDPGSSHPLYGYLGGTMMSSTKDRGTFVDAVKTRGALEFQLQRSLDGGRSWSVVSRSPINPSQDYAYAFLTIPAAKRNMTAQYRFVIPATSMNSGATGAPVSVRHYLASNLPSTDRAAKISDVIRPYCGNIPVNLVNDEYLRIGSYSGAVGMASYASVTISGDSTSRTLTNAKLSFSTRVYGAKTPSYPGVSQDGYSAFAALHECGHAVSRQVLGSSYDAELRRAYGSTDANLDEAIANSLAQHWLKNSNGAITSRYAPRDKYTYLEMLDQLQRANPGVRYPEAEFLHYRGDDALVARITDTALRNNYW